MLLDGYAFRLLYFALQAKGASMCQEMGGLYWAPVKGQELGFLP